MWPTDQTCFLFAAKEDMYIYIYRYIIDHNLGHVVIVVILLFHQTLLWNLVDIPPKPGWSFANIRQLVLHFFQSKNMLFIVWFCFFLWFPGVVPWTYSIPDVFGCTKLHMLGVSFVTKVKSEQLYSGDILIWQVAARQMAAHQPMAGDEHHPPVNLCLAVWRKYHTWESRNRGLVGD